MFLKASIRYLLLFTEENKPEKKDGEKAIAKTAFLECLHDERRRNLSPSLLLSGFPSFLLITQLAPPALGALSTHPVLLQRALSLSSGASNNVASQAFYVPAPYANPQPPAINPQSPYTTPGARAIYCRQNEPRFTNQPPPTTRATSCQTLLFLISMKVRKKTCEKILSTFPLPRIILSYRVLSLQNENFSCNKKCFENNISTALMFFSLFSFWKNYTKEKISCIIFFRFYQYYCIRKVFVSIKENNMVL